jgi:nucleoside-diphosphate-sugar epimerase
VVPSILVTGGAGYVGSNLVRDLLASGNRVVVLDRLVFGIEPISGLLSNPDFKLIQGDITSDGDLEKAFGLGIDSVVHLAAIVGDPACAADQDTAIRTNIDGTLKVANVSKSAGIERFIFASTCSVYGAGGDKLLNEGSRLNPVSLYAETRLVAERDIAKLADDKFRPTILRFGTIYGLSPRMRFDLVVNFLTLKATRDKKIRIFGGRQWRPFVHVRDVARALMLVLDSPFERVGGQTFNVGDTAENYLLSRIGEIVEGLMPDVDVTTMDEIRDERSYRVSFDKIRNGLGFAAGIKVEDGIVEMKNAIESKAIANPDDRRYYNYKQYE